MSLRLIVCCEPYCKVYGKYTALAGDADLIMVASIAKVEQDLYHYIDVTN